MIVCAALLVFATQVARSTAVEGSSENSDVTFSRVVENESASSAEVLAGGNAGEADLSSLSAAWAAHGLQVLSLAHDSGDPGAITVKVARESLFGAQGLANTHELIRRAVLLRRDFSPAVRWLTVVSVDSQGKERIWSGTNVEAIQPSSEWDAVSSLDPSELADSLHSAIFLASKGSELEMMAMDWSKDGGTDVAHVRARFGLLDTAHIGLFLDQVDQSVAMANQQGGKVSQLLIEVADSSDRLALLQVNDYQLGGGLKCTWHSPELGPRDLPSLLDDRGMGDPQGIR